MWRERWNTRRRAGARQRGAEAVRSHVLEHTAVRMAVVAVAQREHRIKEDGRWRDPARPSRLADCRGYPPAPARLIDVAPGQTLELADSHPGRVEHQRR